MIKAYKILSVLAGLSLVLFINSAALCSEKKNHKEENEKESGIRKESLFDEETVKPYHGEYSKDAPGTSRRLERSFENSPPLIPHDLTGLLPITETSNMCVGCHMPEAAEAVGATPLPKTHFMDAATGKDLMGSLDGKRYNCLQCHVPQGNSTLPVKNTFKPDFRKKKDKTRSSLIDSLNEGVKKE